MSDIDLEALNRVDEVNNLIKRLIEDKNESGEAYEDIDKFLKSNKNSTVFDKTVINKSKNLVDDSSQDAFLKSVERDAKERAERKSLSKNKAETIKCKANDYFKANDFEKAINLYSKAITECNDFEFLYTNRAQAYLKVDKTEEALKDCETALRICPTNHKALLHKGRSLVRLNQFEQAIESYNQVLKIAPNLQKYLQEFFDEANKLKRNFDMKKVAESAFTNKSLCTNNIGDDIIEKLSLKIDEGIEFYIGGLELLLQICNTDNIKLEQLRDDFINYRRLFDKQCEIKKKIGKIVLKDKENIEETEWNLLAIWMELLKKIIMNNECATISLFDDRSVVIIIEFSCKFVNSMPLSLLSPTISVLYYMSNITDIGIQKILDKITASSIISITLTAINLDEKRQLEVVAMALFHNLIQSQRFKITLGKDDSLVSSTINCMYSMFVASLAKNCDDLPSVISAIEMLADNSTIRIRLIKHDKFLDECMKTIEARLPIDDDEIHSSILLQLFTLIHNLLVRSKNSPTGDRVRTLCIRIVIAASHLLSNNPVSEMRSVLIQVLSQMLVVLPDDKLNSWCEYHATNVSVDHDNISMCRSLSRQSSFTDLNYLDKVCKPLKLCITILDARNHPLLSNAIKILTLASKVNQAVRFLCCDVRDRVIKLKSLLYKEKEQLDEVLSGNICLLFINCVNDTPLAEHLSNTSIIKDLLRICADANKTDCKRNAAIFAGNLAQSSHVHRTELSRLNGFNIISKFNNWS